MKRWFGLLSALFLATAAHTFFPASLAAIGAPGQNFDGLGSGFTGPGGTMAVDTASPDPTGEVGPNHYVQAVNAQLAVFNKNGAALLGPVPLNSLWSGFGGDCETNNDGHANVLYDQLADRWVISQVSLTGADGTTRPYQVCVAVSTTPDPTGPYARYAFPTSVPPLSPTLSMWPDGYYLTFDSVTAASAGGSVVCAFDRAQMLTGQPATEQCFSGGGKGVLPVDLDGDVAPAAGNAAYLLALGGDQQSVELRTFKVDWATPANSAVSDPQVIAVTPWLDPSSPSIPQSGGGLLDPVAGRLMRRVTYRALANGSGAILADHTVLNGASAAIRWYEIAIPGPIVNTLPAVTQEGTFSPDADHRWVGAMAMDNAGNIGLGYSASSPSLKPELRYTGQLNTDPAGAMTQGEGTIIAGAGAQDPSVTAWGRDSSLTVDPADGCTFWFAGEYLPGDGTLNWRTRVATFTLPGCATPVPDFTIGVSPASQTITTGSSANYSITTTALNGSTQQIALAVSGLPSGRDRDRCPCDRDRGRLVDADDLRSSSRERGHVDVHGDGNSVERRRAHRQRGCHGGRRHGHYAARERRTGERPQRRSQFLEILRLERAAGPGVGHVRDVGRHRRRRHVPSLRLAANHHNLRLPSVPDRQQRDLHRD